VRVDMGEKETKDSQRGCMQEKKHQKGGQSHSEEGTTTPPRIPPLCVEERGFPSSKFQLITLSTLSFFPTTSFGLSTYPKLQNLTTPSQLTNTFEDSILPVLELISLNTSFQQHCKTTNKHDVSSKLV